MIRCWILTFRIGFTKEIFEHKTPYVPEDKQINNDLIKHGVQEAFKENHPNLINYLFLWLSRFFDTAPESLLLAQMELHSFVAGNKPQGLVKLDGAGPLFIAGQLDEVAAALPGALNGPLKYLPADPPAAKFPLNPHPFHQSAPATLISKIGNEGDLKKPYNLTAMDRHYQFIVGIPVDGPERVAIGSREGILPFFPLFPQRIVRQHLNQ